MSQSTGVVGSAPRPRRPIDTIIRPFQEFERREASGGILLLVATTVALIWANSPFADTYTTLFTKTYLTLGVGPIQLDKPLILWINDGLMAIFFLLVGLEIKREVLVGELSSVEKASLPIFAAIGGMVVPAAVFTVLNWGGETIDGWGIPMATDIAFAIGILALVGSRVPVALKVFLVAFAIVDDLGAIAVIALFYTEQIILPALGLGLAGIALAALISRLGVRSLWPYLILGALAWVAFLMSGVHATVAGVLLAVTIPHRAWMLGAGVEEGGRSILDVAHHAANEDKRQAAFNALADLGRDAQAPLTRLEHALHPFVTWVVMPVFALANAGVSFTGGGIGAISDPLGLGILLGLFVGKPLGIVAFSWLGIRTGLATMPQSVTMKHIFGAGLLGGIGFTMSIFVASLAFGGSVLLDEAKLAILLASLVSGVCGWLLLRSVK
ncbi:MAG TPA: Na+/H+ antiporter NhaA [Bacteroidetes bacterium]|nr:Na+/H+ antiporter NhaA [Bacteroidota bacterium]HEX04379.1 Na+/H+ antiporter NhaA [Bacteroidota bacterium]